MKKVVTWIISIIVILFVGLVLYNLSFNSEYKPSEDEIAMHIKLDTNQDIGLIVFDYTVDNHSYSGGIANADGSLISKTSDNVQVFNKEQFNTSSDYIDLNIQFRIITEYVSPNFENLYDEDITRYLDPVNLKLNFGNSYYLTITGDKNDGYEVSLND